MPTTDGCELVLSLYTQPEPEHRMILDVLRLKLPAQPSLRISATDIPGQASSFICQLLRAERDTPSGR